ncbi:Carboxylesterase NlhH [Thalassocella blandensis]|nr:Carboxylesterase NlhH [Thalassocella blandensis]
MNHFLTKFVVAIILFKVFSFSHVYAETWKDISYLSESEKVSDPYLKERAKLDIYCPDKAKNAPVIVWFHGGGLRSGNKELPERLLNQVVCVVGPNYRLFPKIKSPVYIDDAARAVAWVYHNIEKYGGDKSKLVISGHSAGGYLALMVVMDERWLQKYQMDANTVNQLVPFSGHTITHFTVREERGIKGEQPIVDELAPLFYVRKDAPPITLITGDRELELLGRYEENAYFYRMMKVSGHEKVQLYEMDGYGHMMIEPGLPILLSIAKSL